MKMPEQQRLPVLVGGWPNPVGFVEVGTIAEDGFKVKPTPDDDVPAFGGHTVRLQSSYSIPIQVDYSGIDQTLFLAICGDPIAHLALQFRRINPHWYLNGGDDE